jgi:hypothetical protein
LIFPNKTKMHATTIIKELDRLSTVLKAWCMKGTTNAHTWGWPINVKNFEV